MRQWTFKITHDIRQEKKNLKPDTGPKWLLCNLGMLDMATENGSDNRGHAIVPPTEDVE